MWKVAVEETRQQQISSFPPPLKEPNQLWSIPQTQTRQEGYKAFEAEELGDIAYKHTSFACLYIVFDLTIQY